jgi:hypothetical protein
VKSSFHFHIELLRGIECIYPDEFNKNTAGEEQMAVAGEKTIDRPSANLNLHSGSAPFSLCLCALF